MSKQLRQYIRQILLTESMKTEAEQLEDWYWNMGLEKQNDGMILQP